MKSIAIVGVGLMGASVGLSAKSHGVADKILGYDSNPDHLKMAYDRGVIDGVLCDSDQPEIIIVATPVHVLVDHVIEFGRKFANCAVITDVGSTKQRVVNTLSNLHGEIPYVGSHPMAGSEKKGPSFARPDLLENRPVILTPTPNTYRRVIDRVHDFWAALGGKVVLMTAEEHDQTIAAVSHLPHAVASALAGCTNPDLLSLSAGGWRDTTRVAAAGAGIWTPIFRENRKALLASLDLFSNNISTFRKLLEADDAAGLTAWLEQAKQVRDALGS
jgi:prephenate dehydrogenase